MQTPSSMTDSVPVLVYGSALTASFAIGKKILTRLGFQVRLFRLEEHDPPQFPQFYRKIFCLSLQILLSLSSVIAYRFASNNLTNRNFQYGVRGLITGTLAVVGLALTNRAIFDKTNDRKERDHFIKQCMGSIFLPSLALGTGLPGACSLQLCAFQLYDFTVNLPPSSKLLLKYTENAVEKRIKKEFVDFCVRSVVLNQQGKQYFIAFVNNEWIFRFPRKETTCKLLKQEHWLLERLHALKTLSFPIPHYTYKGNEFALVGYKALPGTSISKKLYLSLTQEKREYLAKDIALFLTQLHTAIPIGEILKQGFSMELFYSRPSIKADKSRTSLELFTLAKEALFVLQNYPQKGTDPVLLHNDLHFRNFTADLETGHLTGVFDFGSAAVGHYAFDFVPLFFTHHELVIQAAAAYAHSRQIQDPVQLAAAGHIALCMHLLLRAQQQQESLFAKQITNHLLAFIPIWKDNKWADLRQESTPESGAMQEGAKTVSL